MPPRVGVYPVYIARHASQGGCVPWCIARYVSWYHGGYIHPGIYAFLYARRWYTTSLYTGLPVPPGTPVDGAGVNDSFSPEVEETRLCGREEALSSPENKPLSARKPL